MRSRVAQVAAIARRGLCAWGHGLRHLWPVILAAMAGVAIALVLIDVHDTAMASCRQVQGLVQANRESVLMRRREIGQPGSASAHYTPIEKLRARQLADGQLALYRVRRCR